MSWFSHIVVGGCCPSPRWGSTGGDSYHAGRY